MIVSIHQPHFLPWIGYLNKAVNSDIFVWLNSVQYRKNYFQNRTLIKNTNEQPLWLTLPVHSKLGMNIDAVKIAGGSWRQKIQKTVGQCYSKTAHFAECWPTLAAALGRATDSLDSVNYETFTAMLELLGIPGVRILRANCLDVESPDPTVRLAHMCAKLGATRYIAGRGGRNYLRVAEFEKLGIEVIWQDFHSEEVSYPQLGKTFVAGLSAIDCLFNVGPERSRNLIEGAWKP